MKYNPIHHRRHSTRLRGYDYSREGAYFITICVKHRFHLFGAIPNREMILNDFGQIAAVEWAKLPVRWPHLELGAVQIMPNHMHGIILIHDVSAVDVVDANVRDNAADGMTDAGAAARAAPTALTEHGGGTDTQIQWAKKPTIGQIIGAYKSCVLTECLKIAKNQEPEIYLGKIWQRNFWDVIIYNVDMFDRISNYIIHNPENWEQDRFFLPE